MYKNTSWFTKMSEMMLSWIVIVPIWNAQLHHLLGYETSQAITYIKQCIYKNITCKCNVSINTVFNHEK